MKIDDDFYNGRHQATTKDDLVQGWEAGAKDIRTNDSNPKQTNMQMTVRKITASAQTKD